MGIGKLVVYSGYCIETYAYTVKCSSYVSVDVGTFDRENSSLLHDETDTCNTHIKIVEDVNTAWESYLVFDVVTRVHVKTKARPASTSIVECI